MGLNKPFNRNFFLIGGNVKTSGGSLSLAKGQLAAVDLSKATADGLKVVSDFAGKPKNAKDFAIRLGIEKKKPGRSYSDKDFSTLPFALNEVVGLSVSAPEIKEHVVDELVLGYNGVAGTEFQFNTGDSFFRIAIKLTGGAIEWRGGRDACEFVGLNVEIPHCDPFTYPDNDCSDVVDAKALILDAVERLKNHQLTGGNKLSDFIDVTPVLSCDNAITANLVQYDYYSIDVCDTGDDYAKALVAAQYDVPVIRTNRKGATSTYQMLLPETDGAPADLTTTVGSILKGCETCPANYTAANGGYVYAFTIEDDGSDQSALITAMTNYVSSTVVKSGNNAGVGFYTAVFSAKITDAQIATLTGTAGARATATVELVGEVEAICTPDTASTTSAWTLGDSINAVNEAYNIWIPDTACGEARLTEVQSVYDNLTIAVAQTRTLTLTGTSGTANVTIGGTNYLATFATSLTVTANNFVSTHAATILADKGVVVTANTGVLTFANVGVALPTIAPANASGDLSGTLAAAANVTAGCQTKYTTSVISNLVGDECNDIYKDAYITVRPAAFENTDWEAASNDPTITPSGNCKTGIRLKSRVFILDGDEALRDRVSFLETSTKIEAAAGFPEEIREGIGSIPKTGYQAKYFSRQQHRTHLGGNLRHLESESKGFFRNAYENKDYLGRVLRGETSNIQDNNAQYVHYTLKVSSFNHTQGFAGRINSDVDYNFFVELGHHTALEDLLNKVATNAGVATVKAFND